MGGSSSRLHRAARRCISMIVLIVLWCGACGLSAAAGHPIHASTVSTGSLGQVTFILHGLQVQPPGGKTVHGKVQMPVFTRYRLRTSTQQKASIRFSDGTTLHMNSSTDAVLQSPNVTFVHGGEAFEALAPGTDHQIQTSAAVAAAIGTTFLVKIVNGASYFMVVRGAVIVRNQFGLVVVKNNQGALVLPGQAPQPAYPVDASLQSTWIGGMPTPQLGENLALDANGGHIIAVSSQRTGWEAGLAIDGRIDTGWASALGRIRNQWLRIGFAGNRVVRLTGVIVDPAATAGMRAATQLRDFTVRISTGGTQEADFRTVLRARCTPRATLQLFPFKTPVQARFIELVAGSNGGSSDGVSVAEFEAVGG